MESLLNITGGGDTSVTDVELEHFIEKLKSFDPSDIGTEKWMAQRSNIEKLNLEAHQQVMQQKHEHVVESLISSDKIQVLVHELIALELWKTKVAPKVFKEMVSYSNFSIKPYMILYEEALLTNLMEVLFYHKDALIEAGDSLLDLVDYCMRKINAINNRDSSEDVLVQKSAKEMLSSTEEDQLKEQKKTIDFQSSMCAISILSFIIQNLGELSLTVTNRLLSTHDVVIAFVHLIERPPWLRKGGGKMEKFNNGQWEKIEPSDRFRLCTYEAHVWMALFAIMADKEIARKYQLNTYRMNQVLKLRNHITDVLLDQISVLEELQKALDQLAFMDPSRSEDDKSYLVIEQVPQIRDNLSKETDWNKVVKKAKEEIFKRDPAQEQQEMKRMAELFSKMTDMLGEDELMNM
eukprot:gb/GECH01013249.1/.p1 GENE.gb/GECH01013249.1/~~gb/GECH01013249.1/.p1  ORF type:complete len:407 (+),score=131.79 gb/GECH01013249.1/:1-1221(+)